MKLGQTIIMGSIEEGSKWWSAAHFIKIELYNLYNQNNSFMQTWKFLTADVKVHAIMRNGEPWAFIYVGGKIKPFVTYFFTTNRLTGGTALGAVHPTSKPPHFYKEPILEHGTLVNSDVDSTKIINPKTYQYYKYNANESVILFYNRPTSLVGHDILLTTTASRYRKICRSDISLEMECTGFTGIKDAAFVGESVFAVSQDSVNTRSIYIEKFNFSDNTQDIVGTVSWRTVGPKEFKITVNHSVYGTLIYDLGEDVIPTYTNAPTFNIISTVFSPDGTELSIIFLGKRSYPEYHTVIDLTLKMDANGIFINPDVEDFDYTLEYTDTTGITDWEAIRTRTTTAYINTFRFRSAVKSEVIRTAVTSQTQIVASKFVRAWPLLNPLVDDGGGGLFAAEICNPGIIDWDGDGESQIIALFSNYEVISYTFSEYGSDGTPQALDITLNIFRPVSGLTTPSSFHIDNDDYNGIFRTPTMGYFIYDGKIRTNYSFVEENQPVYGVTFIKDEVLGTLRTWITADFKFIDKDGNTLADEVISLDKVYHGCIPPDVSPLWSEIMTTEGYPELEVTENIARANSLAPEELSRRVTSVSSQSFRVAVSLKINEVDVSTLYSSLLFDNDEVTENKAMQSYLFGSNETVPAFATTVADPFYIRDRYTAAKTSLTAFSKRTTVDNTFNICYYEKERYITANWSNSNWYSDANWTVTSPAAVTYPNGVSVSYLKESDAKLDMKLANSETGVIDTIYVSSPKTTSIAAVDPNLSGNVINTYCPLTLPASPSAGITYPIDIMAIYQNQFNGLIQYVPFDSGEEVIYSYNPISLYAANTTDRTKVIFDTEDITILIDRPNIHTISSSDFIGFGFSY